MNQSGCLSCLAWDLVEAQPPESYLLSAGLDPASVSLDHLLTRHSQSITSTANSFNTWGLWKLVVVWQEIGAAFPSPLTGSVFLKPSGPSLPSAVPDNHAAVTASFGFTALSLGKAPWFQAIVAMALSEPQATKLVASLSHFAVAFAVHSTYQTLFSWFWQLLSQIQKTNIPGILYFRRKKDQSW